MDRSQLNQNTWEFDKCKLFARVYSQKVSKCPPFAQTHAWRRFLHWSMLQCQWCPVGNRSIPQLIIIIIIIIIWKFITRTCSQALSMNLRPLVMNLPGVCCSKLFGQQSPRHWMKYFHHCAQRPTSLCQCRPWFSHRSCRCSLFCPSSMNSPNYTNTNTIL